MNKPAAIKITYGNAPAVVRILPPGFSVTLPQALGTTASPTFAGLTLSGMSASVGTLLLVGANGQLTTVLLGSNLSITNGTLNATGTGGGGGGGATGPQGPTGATGATGAAAFLA